ncbi:MAG TPA: DNA primase, partial [Pirellulaceae bacterium]|nr:DNA primase [Pirellulaceae bacterium]
MHDQFGYDDKERIRQALSIEEVVGNYLELRRQGNAFTALCPWHDDKRPSLQINPARQSWKCWVCDIGGDIFSFVMRRENVEFPQAMELLAKMAGIQLTRRSPVRTVSGDPNDKPTLYNAMTWVEKQYHEFLKTSADAQIARDYLAERGINRSAIDAFKIGYVPDEFSWLLDRARSSDYSPEVLHAVGMLKQKENSNGYYDRFRGRVIFPIRDRFDRPIAVGGRIIPEFARQQELKHGDPPAKYINSPETKLFSKSEQLYGLNLMRDAIAKTKHLIVVEGYTDVIAAWIAGIDNVVAVLGTALGLRHIKIIRPFADRVTLVLDGDEAGKRRANEVLELFVSADIDLRILTLPDAADPFDFLMHHGAGEFRKLVAKAVDAIDHKIRVETAGIDLLNDTHMAHKSLENILTTIARSPRQMSSRSDTNLLEHQLLSRLSRIFQIDIEQIKRRLVEKRSTNPVSASPEMSPGNSANLRKLSKIRLTHRDFEIIQLILESPVIFPKVFERITKEDLQDEVASEIYSLMCECHRAGKAPDFQTLMISIEDFDLKSLLNGLDEIAQMKSAGSDVSVE